MSEYDDNRDSEEWAPAIGWRKAITRLLLGSLGGALIQAGALLVALFVLDGRRTAKLAILIVAVAGFAHGWLVSVGLVNETGIDPGPLRGAAAVSIVAVAALFFFACCAIQMSSPVAYGCIIVACVTAIITSMVRITLE